MKLTRKNIGDLVWIKWRDHSSSSKWRSKHGLADDSVFMPATFGIYHGNSKYESIVHATYDLDGDTVSETVWILRTDIVEVKVILKAKQVTKL